MTGIKRNLALKIASLLDFFPVVCILGARQVGKTNLAKSLKPFWHYIDLEQSYDRDRIIQDPAFFFKQYPHSIILDEAQSYPEIFATLRGVIDADRDQKGRFIVTGSSSPELQKLVSDSLAGRVAIVELGTLKANELASAPLSDFYSWFSLPKNQLIAEYLTIQTAPLSQSVIDRAWLLGGYPEPTLSNSQFFQKEWFQAYENTYIYRDVAKLFPRLNMQAYQRFLRTLSFLSGVLLNKSQLARDIEIGESAVRDYLQIMEGTYLWKSLPSFESQKIKSIVKMPKGYFCDTGLLHFFQNIDGKDSLLVHPMVGRSFEGFVIHEILSGLQTLSIGKVQAYHYRTKNGAEIDLVLSGVFGIIPIEIKSGVQVPIKKLQAMIRFMDEHESPFGIVISQSSDITWLTPKIIQVPVQYI